MASIHTLLMIVIVSLVSAPAWSCTIFCARDKHGHMWAGNNEDFYWFEFSTQLRIAPKTDSTLSYIYFNYPNHDFPQGGVNEAGLFFDANMVEASPIRNADKKMNFPGMTSDFIRYILGHCKTVREVLMCFEQYKIPELITAQLHFADKAGNMGIITADSAWLTSKPFQVSTNYNLCHDDDDYKSCWRYPIAHAMLSQAHPDLQLMTHICDSTSQRQGASTIYSNVHNLTTGEMWFYYAWDYQTPYKTSFEQLTALGDTVIQIRDLFPDQVVVKAYDTFKKKDFAAALTILNTIDDPLEREEKINLLSQGVLFSFDAFIKTEKIIITHHEQLITEIIEATTDLNIISLIAKQDLSAKNKKLVKQKLTALQKSETSNLLMIGLIIAGIIGVSFIIKKFPKDNPSTGIY